MNSTAEISPETARQVLDLELPEDNDAGVGTIREYLIRLLEMVWYDGESFSGKRPFGNSGWDYDLLIPLVGAGLISGSFDEHGYPEDIDDAAGNTLILAAIRELGRVDA